MRSKPQRHKQDNKIFKLKKSNGPDKIPPKLVKLAANIIDHHKCNIVNQSISSSTLPAEDKIANVRPIYKKDKRKKLKTIDPSQFYHLSQVLSEFILGYKKAYSTNHVLLRLMEQIVKLYAYGFSENSLTFFYSYLKHRKQNV